MSINLFVSAYHLFVSLFDAKTNEERHIVTQISLHCSSAMPKPVGFGAIPRGAAGNTEPKMSEGEKYSDLGGKYFFFFFLFSFFLFLCVFVKIATLILLELCQIERTKTISQCLTFIQTD